MCLWSILIARSSARCKTMRQGRKSAVQCNVYNLNEATSKPNLIVREPVDAKALTKNEKENFKQVFLICFFAVALFKHYIKQLNIENKEKKKQMIPRESIVIQNGRKNGSNTQKSHSLGELNHHISSLSLSFFAASKRWIHFGREHEK